MTTIEIYERKTGETLEIKEVGDIRAWQFYFSRQCDTVTYGWRYPRDSEESALEQTESAG
jgi:hypothetical protein